MPDRITSVGNGVDSVADTPESRILSEVALFQGLPAEQLSKIEARLRRKTFPAGAQVIIAEEPDETVYVLLERRSLASYAPWVGATNNGAERSARAFRHLQAPH